MILTEFIGNPKIVINQEPIEPKKEQVVHLGRKPQQQSAILAIQPPNPIPSVHEFTHQPKEQWACENCTFLNQPKYRACQMCNKIQDLDVEKIKKLKLSKSFQNLLINKDDTIKCEKCTFENSICTSCGNKNPDEEFVGWTCGNCTVNNKPLIRSCVVCDNRRPVDYVVPKDYITFDPDELAILERDKAADISIEVFLVIILFTIFYNISFLFYFS